MKQNLPAAKSKRLLVTLLTTSIVFASACARLPKSTQFATQLRAELPKTERAAQININTASAEELEKLPGVGKAIGERIVAHRKQYGRFRRAEHLMIVRGISDKKFRELRSLIAVE
ncbi:MAG TPA: helix-hairpin-helix domain-containing protein [Pyrinomonadaceae bacterium]|nr:helix-hairpin-helix domain-containing protein [Pyrinomonadaceae bacterium]